MATTSTVPAPSAQVQMSVGHFYVGIGSLMLAIVGGLFLHGWMTNKASVEQQVQAINAQAAQQVKADQAKVQQADTTQQDSSKQLAQQLALINAAKSQPVQAVDYDKIDQMIASQLKLAASQVQTTQDSQTKVPETTVPTQQLRDFTLDAQATDDKLSDCTNQLSAEKLKTLALTDQVVTQEKQIAATDKVLKGGTFWHRVKTGLKHGMCGAASAGAGIAIGRAGGIQAGGLTGLGVYGACEAMWSVNK